MGQPATSIRPVPRRGAVRSALVATVLAALVLAGCGDGNGDGPAESTTTTKAPATTSTTGASDTSTTSTTTGASGPDADVACGPAGDESDKQSADRAVPPVWLLSDVRTSRCDGKDRVVFEFRTVKGAPTATPPFDVEYDRPPFRDSGEGRETTVEGEAFLEVKLFPSAIADLEREGAPMTYTGPRSITPEGTGFVKQLALFDAFEGYVSWAVGLDQRRPFTVRAVAGDRPRVVIDIG